MPSVFSKAKLNNCKVCRAILALGVDADLVEKFHKSEICLIDFPKQCVQDILEILDNADAIFNDKHKPKEKVVFT